MKMDFKRMWDEAGQNVDRLHGCKRHRFNDADAQPFQRMTCLECGGELGLRDVSLYIRGYIAAGGNPVDIWPAYGAYRAKNP